MVETERGGKVEQLNNRELGAIFRSHGPGVDTARR